MSEAYQSQDQQPSRLVDMEDKAMRAERHATMVYEQLRRKARDIASQVNAYLCDKEHMKALSHRDGEDAQRSLDVLDSVRILSI